MKKWLLLALFAATPALAGYGEPMVCETLYDFPARRVCLSTVSELFCVTYFSNNHMYCNYRIINAIPDPSFDPRFLQEIQGD